MIVYEVIAQAADDIADEFEEYLLDRHIPDVMETGCFESFELFREVLKFQVRYTLDSHEKLDHYIEHHAQALRADVAEHFPQELSFERHVWQLKSRSVA